MTQKRKRRAARQSVPAAKRKSRSISILSRLKRRNNLPLVGLTPQSVQARNRALHVLAAIRRDPRLSLSRAGRRGAVGKGGHC